jgi:biotin carboxyl carrier protein
LLASALLLPWIDDFQSSIFNTNHQTANMKFIAGISSTALLCLLSFHTTSQQSNSVSAFVANNVNNNIILPSNNAITNAMMRHSTSLNMADSIKITMPALSSTMKEGRVVSWLKQEGDEIEAGEAIMVVESDKADMDVEAFEDGYLAKILTGEGETAEVGAVVALVATSEEDIAVVAAGGGDEAAPAASEPVAAAPAAEAPASGKLFECMIICNSYVRMTCGRSVS